MKECKRCNEVKDLSEFHLSKKGEKGRFSYCKPCRSEYNTNNKVTSAKRLEYCRKWEAKKKQDFYSVYLLPEENYVGITTQPELRMRHHKNAGRNTSNWVVMANVDTRKEAVEYENMFNVSYGYKISFKE